MVDKRYLKIREPEEYDSQYGLQNLVTMLNSLSEYVARATLAKMKQQTSMLELYDHQRIRPSVAVSSNHVHSRP